MLVSAQLSRVSTVDRLVNHWSNRYLPDVMMLSIGSAPETRQELRTVSSAQGRAQTAAKLHKRLVEQNCKLAAIRTKDLYAHLSEGLDFGEANRLAHFASLIYDKLLEVYQTAPSVVHASKKDPWTTVAASSLAAWGVPKIDRLADTLEPLLLQFQEQHIISKNWRTLGFITTQINFSNALLLDQSLTPVEQTLLSPYFKFVEEQVALPWQRVCAAAAKHHLTSPPFVVVERLMPLASEISVAVYDRLLRAFSKHHSRRGRLNNPATKHSCLRDLDMFQAYLWLCLLQGNLTVVQQELVALCVMVFESVGVTWEMTARGTELLMAEVLERLNFQEKAIVRPYAEGMMAAFDSQRASLGS